MESLQQKPNQPKPIPATLPVKQKSPLLGIIIAVLVTAIVIGGATYVLLMMKTNVTQIGLSEQIVLLETENSACASDLATCQAEKIAFEEAFEAEDPAYATWLTYTDNQYGISWRYPANWTVDTTPAGAETLNGKDIFCVNFNSPATEARNIRLDSCYRQQYETNATTWGITGLGYNEMSKVGLDFMMADKKVTEKTLFGEPTSIATIIYSQNYKDDETGYPARMAIDDYYVTAIGMLDEMLNETNGITTAEQIIMDKILASMELPAEPQEAEPTE